MTGRMVGVVAALCAVMLPIAGHAASVEKIHNEKVVVTEVTLGAGESEKASADHPSLIVYIVYMADGAAVFTPFQEARSNAVKEGWVVMEPAGATVRNPGKMPLHFARIEFMTRGEDETWGMTGLLSSYKMVSEDRYARTYEIKVPAGAVEPQHTHHARVVLCLSGTEMEHTLPDGTKQLATLKTGDILWREAATHAGHNLGKTELWEIAVEPK